MCKFSNERAPKSGCSLLKNQEMVILTDHAVMRLKQMKVPDPRHVKIKKVMKAPICDKCGKYCNPSGGTVDNRIKFWTCFNCGYKVEDVPYEEVKLVS